MTWNKIDKGISNWSKSDKIYMGFLVNGFLVYGFLIVLWEKITKSTSNWTKVNKEE